MNTTLMQSLLLAFVLLTTRGAQAADEKAASKTGAPCDAYNNVGALFEIDAAGRQSLLCSAVLIEDDVVLTAAHCVTGDKDAPWNNHPMRLLFVTGERPFPTKDASQFVVNAVKIDDGFRASSLVASPLFAREAQDEEEGEALKTLEKRCGKRDPQRFGSKEWMQCLLAQSPELQRAVGLDDGEAHDNDIALLFLQPNWSHERRYGSAFPRACNVRQTKQGDADSAPPPPHTKERLRLVGFGHDKAESDERRLSDLFRYFFRRIERRNEEVHVAKTRDFEVALNNKVRTCAADSGAALFRRPQPTRPAQLVGIFSRPEAQRSDVKKTFANCNKGGVATNLSAYWGWVDAQLKEACAHGHRFFQQCPEMAEDAASRPKRRRVIDPVETDG